MAEAGGGGCGCKNNECAECSCPTCFECLDPAQKRCHHALAGGKYCVCDPQAALAGGGGGGGKSMKEQMCDDCKRVCEFICKECEKKMCDGCLTGDTCQNCEKNVCCLGDCDGELAFHSSGKHRYCWSCILSGIYLLGKEEAAKVEEAAK